jgi:hypothetical protein
MNEIKVIGDDGNEDAVREQILLDQWADDGYPDPEAWLAEHCEDWTPAPIKVGRPSRREANELPVSELMELPVLTKPQAARLLSVSVDWLEDHVLKGPGRVRTIKRGKTVLILKSDLLRWLDANSERPI